jgi:hypothetical protein
MNKNPNEININYYEKDTSGDNILIAAGIAAIIIVIIIFLYDSMQSRPKKHGCSNRRKEYYSVGSDKVWSGKQEKMDSSLTPLRANFRPDFDAPLSMTAQRKNIDIEHARTY